MLRLRLALFVLSVAACGPSESPAASTPPAAPAPTAAPAPVAPPELRPTWLYEVGPEATPSYVFASADGARSFYDSFPESYVAITRFARVLVVEDAEEPEMREHVVAAMRRGHPASPQLSREAFRAYTDLMAGDIPMPTLLQLPPLFAWMMLEAKLRSEPGGHDFQQQSVSHELVSRRRMAGESVIGFDDVATFDSFVSALGDRALLDCIEASLEHLEERRAYQRAIFDAYLSLDEAAVVRAYEQPTAWCPAVDATARASTDRARARHAPAIEREVATGNALIVLPADEVLATDGVLATLRAHGVRVVRIEEPVPST